MNRHERRKQEKLDRKGGIVSPPKTRLTLPPVPGPGSPTVIAHYGDPLTLVMLGPLIQGIWSVPAALVSAFQAAGRPVPPAVPGYLLVDTGATKTSMALAVAEELQLTRIRLTRTLGAGGVTPHGVYFGHLSISIPDSFGNVTLIESDREAAGLLDLDKALDPRVAQNTANPNLPTRVIGLLGRDFLQFTTMTYHGSSGLVELVLDLQAIQRATRTVSSNPGALVVPPASN